MKITVSQSIIDEGCERETFGDPSNCPIARAVFRQLGLEDWKHYINVVDQGSEHNFNGKSTARVSIRTYTRNRQNERLEPHREFYAGRAAWRFIKKFDRHGKAKPFTFILKEVS